MKKVENKETKDPRVTKYEEDVKRRTLEIINVIPKMRNVVYFPEDSVDVSEVNPDDMIVAMTTKSNKKVLLVCRESEGEIKVKRLFGNPKRLIDDEVKEQNREYTEHKARFPKIRGYSNGKEMVSVVQLITGGYASINSKGDIIKN